MPRQRSSATRRPGACPATTRPSVPFSPRLAPPHAPAWLVLAVSLLAAGCAGGGGDGPAPDRPDTLPSPPPAPWSGATLRPTAAPQPLLTEWSRAENRQHCALLAPAEPRPAEAEPRPATFGGGWGVAWDLPDLRSAFGVAGTGVEPGPDTYDDWPHRLRWEDGSEAGYGPEGGSGPNQLAYLRIPGQDCLYNVWSRIGREHLEDLLRTLRFVETSSFRDASDRPSEAVVISTAGPGWDPRPPPGPPGSSSPGA